MIDKQEIGLLIKHEIIRQKISIEELSRRTISKRIIYNIIQGKGYTIDSLMKIIRILKTQNPNFNIGL